MTDVHPLDDPLRQPSPAPEVKPRRNKGHVQSFAAGRTCSDVSCATVLSRYNDTGRCWLHTVDPRHLRP